MVRTLSSAFALTMLLAGAALAQTSTTPQTGTGTTPPAASSGSGTGGAAGAAGNCREEIAKAEPLINAASGDKKATATRELGMAKDSLAKNDERTCMTHVANANQAVK